MRPFASGGDWRLASEQSTVPAPRVDTGIIVDDIRIAAVDIEIVVVDVGPTVRDVA